MANKSYRREQREIHSFWKAYLIYKFTYWTNDVAFNVMEFKDTKDADKFEELLKEAGYKRTM